MSAATSRGVERQLVATVAGVEHGLLGATRRRLDAD